MANVGIYNALLQPPKTYQDYADEDAKRQANMLALQTNQQNLLMGKQKLDEYQRGIQEQQTIRNALAALGPGATDDQRINALKNTGLASGFTQADALMKSGIERTKAQAEADKNTEEAKAKRVDTAHKMLDYGIQGLQTIGDPSTATNYINQGVARGYWSMEDAQRMVAGMPKDPAQFGDWRVTQLRALLAAKDQLPKTGNVSMGGFERYFSTDPVTGKTMLTATEAKTQSPDNAATTSLGYARLNEDKRQFNEGQASPQYLQTEAGLVAVPKKLPQGQTPSATVVTGPNGESLGKPLKDIPPAQNQAIIENSKALQNIDAAIQSIQQNPGALGVKNMAGDTVSQFVDPTGTSVRAQLANVAGQRFHDLSGAAISASEASRLRPFIPAVTDRPEVALEKLQNLKREYQSVNDMLSQTYSKEQGYKPSPVQGKKERPSLDSFGRTGGQRPSLDSFNR